MAKIKLNRRLNEGTLQQDVEEYSKEYGLDYKDVLDEIVDAADAYNGVKFDFAMTDIPEMSKDTDIEKALDNSLRVARKSQREFVAKVKHAELNGKKIPKPEKAKYGTNLLIMGPPGTGKTQRVRQWCDDHDILLVEYKASEMDPTDFGGIIMRQVDESGSMLNKTTRLTNSEFDVLDTPDTVIFLDELNRAPADITGALLTLVQDHLVTDASQKTHKKYLSGILFTVSAVNPADEATGIVGANRIDMAMGTRHRRIHAEFDKIAYLHYLKDEYEDLVNGSGMLLPPEDRLENYRKILIAKKVLLHPDFEFDDETEQAEAADMDANITTNRTFSMLLRDCDGTVQDFLDKWSEFCNPNKQGVVEDALRGTLDYNMDDVPELDNKANDLINNFKKQNSVKQTTMGSELLDWANEN